MYVWPYLRRWRFQVLLAGLIATSFSTVSAQNYRRSYQKMTTGNGHGFQVFDRDVGAINSFLEHPYLFLSPLDEARDGGVERRDLGYDIYFGVDINGRRQWLNQLNTVEYEDQSHIIKATTDVSGANIEVRYFGPFGLEANAMIMAIRIKNPTANDMQVTAFAKPNMKLGRWTDSRRRPGDVGEKLSWTGRFGVETGPAGGHAIYYPIGGSDLSWCGRDFDLFTAVENGETAGANFRCAADEGSAVAANDQTMVTGKSATIPAGGEFWWGQAVLFVNDNPSDPQAFDFRDVRSGADVVAQWEAFAGDKTAQVLVDEARAEFEAWRVTPESLGLNTLTADEKLLWRQSETILRLGQVMEPIQANRRNRGMFLAALPEGEWHMAWVRDGAYAIVSQAMNGHHREARLGVESMLNAWAGFFSGQQYLGRDYRISSVRYFGNGKEEGDFNFYGPNVETDGFGLVLWAARNYLHYSCDAGWLQTTTLHGDTVFDALKQVAEDIDGLIENDLPTAETSIWEVHWDHRQVFTYTAATQIKGLYDFAAIALVAGRADLTQYYRERARRMLDATLSRLVNQRYNSFASHEGVASQEAHVDGSTVEMLAWDFVEPGNPIFEGTLQLYERLLTTTGGYRRLEPNLSLTEAPQAGTYDLSEWVLLDLRIGDTFRKAGNAARADELLDKITQTAKVNDWLVPELFDPNQSGGIYTGVIPMVGYGAGAWQMTQLEKVGLRGPRYDDGWEVCARQPNNQNPGSGNTNPGDDNQMGSAPAAGGSPSAGDPQMNPNDGDTNGNTNGNTGADTTSDSNDGNSGSDDTGEGNNPFAMADTIADELPDMGVPGAPSASNADAVSTYEGDEPAGFFCSSSPLQGDPAVLFIVLSVLGLTRRRGVSR